MRKTEKNQTSGAGEKTEQPVDASDAGRSAEAMVTDWANAEASGLDTYFSMLRRLAPLSADEQRELARRYHEENDRTAAELLLSTNLRLVVKIAREYCRRPNELLDIIQEGNLGLVEALERFEPDRGVKFTTYAQHWVRAMILGYLINQKYPVRLGTSRSGRTVFYNLNKARKKLLAAGERPTAEAVAAELGVDESDVVAVAAQLDGGAVRLDGPLEPESDVLFVESLTDDAPAPDVQLEDREMTELLQSSVETFGEKLTGDRKRCIWFERVVADDPKTLRELGEDFDVSKERVRQIEVELQEAFSDALHEELPELVQEDVAVGS